MATTYVYKPLRTSQTIRILHLEPAKAKDAPLIGHFSETDLNKAAPYNALSYTWNDETPSMPLLVDGQTVLITPNCASALRRLRKSRRVRPFWIDAVCINQSDTQERNAQVAVMGDIFKNSAWVFAWLGEGTDLSQKGRRRLQFQMQLGDYLHPLSVILPIPLCLGLVPVRARVSISQRAHRLYYAGSSLDHFQEDLCERPYWSRVWTTQEFRANDKCRIYFDSARGLSARTFFNFIANDRLRFLSLHGQRAFFSGSSMYEDIVIPLELLEKLHASEPRDHVYALKPILPKILQPVKVDYNAPVGQVFQEATRGYASYLQRVDFLNYATMKSDIQDLPSWAVDWSLQKQPPSFPRNHYNDSSRNRPQCVDFSTDSSIMKVRGLKILEFDDCFSELFPPRMTSVSDVPLIETVRSLSLVPASETRYGIIFRKFLCRAYGTDEESKARAQKISVFSKFLDLFDFDTRLRYRPWTEAQNFENWYRRLIADTTTSGGIDLHDGTSIGDQLQQPMHWGMYHARARNERYLGEILAACDGKRLFMAGEKIGVCWPEARAGDQLIRVKDKTQYERLLILRPKGHQFLLVGHAVLSEETLGERNESELQWFELI